MALADVGAFGQGWIEGQQRGLSNYVNFAHLAMQRDAEDRARQAQALQTLIHGTSLAQTAPDVAERAAQQPDVYGLSPETVGPAAAQTRGLMAARGKLANAISTGNFQGVMDDPMVGQVIKEHPEKWLKEIRDAMDRAERSRLLNDPNIAPEEKARRLFAMNGKDSGVSFTEAYPTVLESTEAAKARGGLRGQQGLIGSVTREKSAAEKDTDLQYSGPIADAKRRGEYSADLAPGQPGLPGSTNAGQLAIQKETPAQREYRTSHNPPGEIKPTDVSNALNRNRVQARQEVGMTLSHAKPVFDVLPPQQQGEIIEYYTRVKQNQLMSQDPVLANQPREPLPPKPQSVLEFEGQVQKQGWGDWFKGLFGGGSSTPAATPEAPTESVPAQSPPTRTLRTPGADAIQAPPGIVNKQGQPARDGDTIIQKSTGRTFILQNGMLIPQ